MKKLVLIFCFLCFYSCEEVVDVELEESDPRLVIEASLLWDQKNDQNVQYIKLTRTAAFFKDEIPAAENAEVSVFSSTGTEYIFQEVEPGLFTNNQITPVAGETYSLEIVYEDEVYRATSEFITAPALDFVVQENDGGFSGEDIELKVFYTDPAEETNFYLFRFFSEDLDLQIYNDEFTNGSQTFAFFTSEELERGAEVAFEIQGISESFYQYMFILRSQAGTGGGPFQTQPTLVRGNIVNTTDPDNYPFGYFRLSGTNFLTYTIE